MRIANAPERAAQRVEAQIALGPHPRHIHPARNRLSGGALKKAIGKREADLSAMSLQIEKRDMAAGRVTKPSSAGLMWLWGMMFGDSRP